MRSERKRPVILVEGKTDVQKIKKAFPDEKLEFLVSGGLGFDHAFLELCKEVNLHQGLIILTDPDGPGKKIRDTVNEALNFNCQNAFIEKATIKGQKKVGIAEAPIAEIRRALEETMKFNPMSESLSWEEYLNNDFNIKQNRKKIACHFKWSEELNAKTLFKWLNFVEADVKAVEKILKGNK